MKQTADKKPGSGPLELIKLIILVPFGVCAGAFIVNVITLQIRASLPFGAGILLCALLFSLCEAIERFIAFIFSESPKQKENRLQRELTRAKHKVGEESASFLAARRRAEEDCAAALQFSSQGSHPKGWRVQERLGVVRCVADLRSEANGRLGYKAAELGGNALIDINYLIVHTPDRLPAGLDDADDLRAFEERVSRSESEEIQVERIWRGPVKVWEAMAVRAQRIVLPAQAPLAVPARQPDPVPSARKAGRSPAQSPMTDLDPDHDKLVIDGNNLLLETCDPLDGDVRFDTAVLKKIAAHLEQSGFDYHVFFDANIHWLLLDRRASDEEIAALTGFAKRKFTRVPRGQEADTFILNYAREQSAVILSNDYFGKYRATYDFLDDPSRKTGYTRSGPLVLIPRLASIRI